MVLLQLAADKLARGEEVLRRYIARSMFVPEYSSLIHLPVGVRQ